jgi:hypothetical protein
MSFFRVFRLGPAGGLDADVVEVAAVVHDAVKGIARCDIKVFARAVDRHLLVGAGPAPAGPSPELHRELAEQSGALLPDLDLDAA